MLTTKDIMVAINKNFNSGYGFPHDFISAKLNDSGDLLLRIGHRDIQIDEKGNCVGSGSLIKSGFKIEVCKES